MSDLRARERHDPEWGATVADLVEDDRVVGIVYASEGGVYAEFYADADDGAPWVFEVADLQRALDTAAAMVAGPESAAAAPEGPVGEVEGQEKRVGEEVGPGELPGVPGEQGSSTIGQFGEHKQERGQSQDVQRLRLGKVKRLRAGKRCIVGEIAA